MKSVDNPKADNASQSPSSRRAWIEIMKKRFEEEDKQSPSSRRAWIEISSALCRSPTVLVALLAEGVD